MKTLSIYAVVATLAFGQINAAALPSDDSDFHVVKDTELGPIYSNVSPKDRRDDSKWYLVRNDADHPVYSSVDPAQVSKRDRPHGGPPQSGPGGPGGRPDWTNSHHPQDTGSNNNNNNNNNNNKNDGNSSSTSSNDNGGTDATKTDTDTTTTDTDTDTSKRDEAYTPAPQSEVEGWIKDHPVGKRDLVERGEIEKRTYKQCVQCVAACHLIQAGIYQLSISQQLGFCLSHCRLSGSCTEDWERVYYDQYGPQFQTK